jgi:mRNA interferase MazF
LTSQRIVRRGDIFWIEPELLRPSVPGVAHPHVVIQEDVLNLSRVATTVVCGVTSNLKRANEPGNVLLRAGEGNLPEASVVLVSQVSAVDKVDLTRAIGSLSEERIVQIVAGMRFLQKSFLDR